MITNTEIFNEAKNKAQELEVIDFKSTDNLEIDTYYEAIQKIANKNKRFQDEEAENIITEYSKTYITDEFLAEINKRRFSILDLIKKYDPNTDVVNTMSTFDVEKVYVLCNYLFNSYITYINEMEFNFELSRNEFTFLNKVLTTSIEYNADEVFNYVELYDKFWEGAKAYVDANKALETYTFKMNIKMILILHHLIKEFKVKGNTMEFKFFKNILLRIGQTNKLFNAFNIAIERIKDDCKLWGSAVDEIISRRDAPATTDTDVSTDAVVE